ASEKQRQPDQKPLHWSGNLPGDHIGAEEGPLAGSEELEPEKIDLDIVLRVQLEAQSVVDSEKEQAHEEESQDSRGWPWLLLKPTALLTDNRQLAEQYRGGHRLSNSCFPGATASAGLTHRSQTFDREPEIPHAAAG